MRIKKTPCRSAESRGYSLLELLMVMTLLPMVFFAVYSNFSTGFRVWARVIQATPEEDLDIFFHKVRADVQNMQRLASLPFEGGADDMAFAGAIEARPELGGELGIGEVRLYYDKSARRVFREVKDYSQIYKEAAGTQSVLLDNVTSFEWAYLSNSTLDTSYSWSDSWKPEPGKLPVAVKMSFSVAGIPGTRELVVFIPAGGSIKK